MACPPPRCNAALSEMESAAAAILGGARVAHDETRWHGQHWREAVRADQRRSTAPLGADLAATGGLRIGLSLEDVADVIWATNSPEFYLLLVRERGWAPERFEQWLADIWGGSVAPCRRRNAHPRAGRPGRAAPCAYSDAVRATLASALCLVRRQELIAMRL